MNNEDVIYTYNGILLSNKKKNKILPLATMWINLECIILSEARERQIFCMLPLICEIFKKKMYITKQKWTHRYREQTNGDQ